MITYRLMDEDHQVPTCLHGGPVKLSDYTGAMPKPAYIETLTDLPCGTVFNF